MRRMTRRNCQTIYFSIYYWSNIWSAWIFSYYDWIEYVCKYAWWTRYETPINCHFVCVINRTVYGGISRVFPRFWRYDSYGVSQVIEQFIRVFFMLAIAFLFVYWNKESDVVTGGAMIGSCLGVITSLIHLRLKYVKSIYRYKSNTYSLQDFKDNAKRYFRFRFQLQLGHYRCRC